MPHSNLQLFQINPRHLVKHPVLSKLLPIDLALVQKLVGKMRGGYHDEEPIVVWEGDEGLYVVDGHTRWAAALEACLDTVTIVKKPFKTLQEAIDYAYARQDRRHTRKLEILHVLIHSTLCTRGGLQEGSSTNTPSGVLPPDHLFPKRSQEDIARLLGVGERSVARAKQFLDRHVSPQQSEAIRSGKMSVYDLPLDEGPSAPEPVAAAPEAPSNLKPQVAKSKKQKRKRSEYPPIEDYFDAADLVAIKDLARNMGVRIKAYIFVLAQERLKEYFRENS
jgi:hypothetical protein